MHIYKLHTTASGEIFALIDPRLTPPGVKRSTYNGIGPRDKGNDYTCFEDVPFRTPDTSGPPVSNSMFFASSKSQTERPIASWVALNDLAKCKVYLVTDGYASIDLASVPEGVARSTYRNHLIKESGVAKDCIDTEVAKQIASAICLGPKPNTYDYGARDNTYAFVRLSDYGPRDNAYAFVRLSDLIAAAQGKPATVAAATSGSKLPASPTTMVDGIEAKTCLERYVRIMQAEDPKKLGFTLTPKQKDAAREMWSAQLRAKVQASDAEAKRKDREQVLVELHPDDLL